jgi:hypothetical protein
MATSGAVQPLLSTDWLKVDTKANSGSGTTPQVNPGATLPNPQVPLVDPVIPFDQPNVAPVSDGTLYDGQNWGDAWPTFSQGQWTQGPAQTPEADIPDQPENMALDLTGPGTVRVTLNQYAGYNAQAQVTDNAGWKVNTPSGRSSQRKLLGANGVGYEDQWYQTASRPVPARFAKVAVPNNSPEGTPGVLNGATLSNFADINYGGSGNVAYSTPAPPATTTPQNTQTATSDWQGW